MSDTRFPDHGDDRYFSLDGLRGILRRAREQGYVITPFRDFAPPGERPVLLLRHDLDHDLESARIVAALEAEEGVAATYFVQTACDFYNLLGTVGRAAIREIADAGHEIGLHYAAARYVGPGGAAAIAADVRLLEDLGGRKVVSAAQHIPIDDGAVDLSAHICHDAYHSRFTSGDMIYISDSLMQWRAETPHDLLDARRSFQLLVHPECWTAHHRNMAETMTAVCAAQVAETQRLCTATLDHYATLLAERAERDRAFKVERGWLPDG